MNIMSKFVWLLLFTVCLSSCSFVFDKKDSVGTLEFEVILNKRDYSINENIVCDMILTNGSSQPILVNQRMAFNDYYPIDVFWEVGFIFTSPSGNDIFLIPRVNTGPPGENDYIMIDPGVSVLKEIILNEWFGPFDTPGLYTVKAVYTSRDYSDYVDLGDNVQAWEGEIISEVVDFNILR
jgi:hypothetical protein